MSQTNSPEPSDLRNMVTKMNVDKTHLHDALLKSMAVDYAEKSVTIRVDFYKSKGERKRISALMSFDEVQSISKLIDLKELEEHTFAGHISYWKPAKASGTTYIYLSAGCIAIDAKKVQFKIVRL
jgi:hypothetical protein